MCRGALQWRNHPPHLSDIVSIANTASAVFKYYNCYNRQCYWYARVILATMAKAFLPFSKEGTASFHSKKRFAMFGRFKPSQVQLLVDLHSICGRNTPVCPPRVHSGFIVTPDSLQNISSLLIGCLETSLAQLLWLQPAADAANKCCDRIRGREKNSAGGWR
ncbi:hypothetical protein EDC04DRAFT_2662589 [Pisolithus marmoratus]|nr:hypothetical protein EDC04DRAFT_2662589 [Pisolithus marmoratus]